MAIGCGTCSLWEPIIGKWKFELWGIDIDEGKIEMAKKVQEASFYSPRNFQEETNYLLLGYYLSC